MFFHIGQLKQAGFNDSDINSNTANWFLNATETGNWCYLIFDDFVPVYQYIVVIAGTGVKEYILVFLCSFLNMTIQYNPLKSSK